LNHLTGASVTHLQADRFSFFRGQQLAELGDLVVEHLLHARLAEAEVPEVPENKAADLPPGFAAGADDTYNQASDEAQDLQKVTKFY